MSPIIFLIGPTAAGKTDLALELVASFPLEIVSIDSALIYRGMNIGTGKPSADVLAQVPHHLVDILDPSERYSAGQFVRDAYRAIEDIRARGKVPLLVGGTMMYFKALTQGIADLPAANPDVRTAIDARGKELGWPALHGELAQIDPVAATKILPNDAQRIQRALEVYQLTGTPLSQLQAQARAQAQSDSLRQSLIEHALSLVWCPADRSALYDRIALRFERMLADGFVDEVRQLYVRGDLTEDLPAVRAVGYRQLWGYCAGRRSLAEAVGLGVTATRQLARRQLIWLRALANLVWFDSSEPQAPDRIKSQIRNALSAKL